MIPTILMINNDKFFCEELIMCPSIVHGVCFTVTFFTSGLFQCITSLKAEDDLTFSRVSILVQDFSIATSMLVKSQLFFSISCS